MTKVEEEAGDDNGGEITYEELYKISREDCREIQTLYELCFPIRYGDQFYRGLESGMYAGQHLVSFIGRRNGVVVGVVCASKEDASSNAPESVVVDHGNTTYVMTLAVKESERRRGLASKLMGNLLHWAQQSCCTACYLHVIEYNTSAMEFYRKLGFAFHTREDGFYPQIEGKDYSAMVYVMYFNGGKPPPPKPLPLLPSINSQFGVLDMVFDWITSVFGRWFSGGDSIVEEEEAGDHSMV
ncbi:hypothetical protein BASA81_008027 [Batrachochytrium salamandrivorans]|nr:hypothetical protein BASA81_008027 [Batrachochytrium salamandrivorans]